MNFKTILIKLLILCVVFTSCSNDSDDNSGDCESIDIPFLLEGNSWNYKITSFGAESGEIELTIGACNGNGLLVDRAVLDYASNQTTTATDLWKQEDGFIQTDSNNNGDYFAKIYKKDAQLGDMWTHTKDDGAVVTHEVIAIDSMVTVPAGTFSCKVFRFTATDIINDSHVFWNDQLGNIKEDAGFFQLDLLSYSN